MPESRLFCGDPEAPEAGVTFPKPNSNNKAIIEETVRKEIRLSISAVMFPISALSDANNATRSKVEPPVRLSFYSSFSTHIAKHAAFRDTF